MSIATVKFLITNASPPFEFSVKDINGIERFTNQIGDLIYFNSPIDGVYTVKVSKGNCQISSEIVTVGCDTITDPPLSCTKPILTLNSITNDKRATFTITNVSDCQGMELQYSTNSNFNNYIPIYISCAVNQVITFPTNDIYYVRIAKTCVNTLLQYSNVVSFTTVSSSNNCYIFAGCLATSTVANFDNYRITLKSPTGNAVNFTLSNGSILTIPAGDFFVEKLINISQGCPTIVSNDLNLIFCNTIPSPIPVPVCTGITNLTITGVTNVEANSTKQYSVSYTGNPPLNYSWGIAGQGTSIISGQNANTVFVKFGSSGNFILNLDVVDQCGNTISATKQISLQTVNVCDIIVSNIAIVCNGNNSSTVTVTANSPSNKVLRYGVLGFVNYQTSNVFNLPNSDSNGYTFQVVELGNETNCFVNFNRMVTCSVVPTPPVPVVCDLSITSVSVVCNSVNNATLTVNVSNPSNYVLEYQIDNYITWQNNNIFTGITNTGTGYIIRVRNKNNTSCSAFKNTGFIDCQSITPIPSGNSIFNSMNCSNGILTVSGNFVAANNFGMILFTSTGNVVASKDNLIGGIFNQTFNNVSNGDYFIRLYELNNDANRLDSSTFNVNCVVVPTPVTPTPSPIPVSCDVTITNVAVNCVSANNGTLTVSVNNPSNYTLQYNIDGFGLPWQSSNVFTGITNGSNYTLRVRNANNISCEALRNNVVVNCQTVPNPTPTPSPVPSPVSCIPITNLTINGNSTIVANSQNTYTSNYSGDRPYSYRWSISGQGTSVIGANNAGFVTFQMGSSNGTITLTVTNCGGTYSVDFPFSQSVVINSCDVIFNNNPNPDIYKYDVSTDTVSVIGTAIGSSDIAMTDTKLWVSGVDIIYEYNITKNPFTINFNRNISYNSSSFGAGLVAINNTTLVTGANTITSLNISGNTAIETPLFNLPTGSFVTGDIVYKSNTDTYIITYNNNMDYFVGEFSSTGMVIKSGVIGISAAYGIIAVNGLIYLCNVNGDLYLLNQSNFSISFAKNIGSNVNGFNISGATQSNNCY